MSDDKRESKVKKYFWIVAIAVVVVGSILVKLIVDSINASAVEQVLEPVKLIYGDDELAEDEVLEAISSMQKNAANISENYDTINYLLKSAVPEDAVYKLVDKTDYNRTGIEMRINTTTVESADKILQTIDRSLSISEPVDIVQIVMCCNETIYKSIVYKSLKDIAEQPTAASDEQSVKNADNHFTEKSLVEKQCLINTYPDASDLTEAEDVAFVELLQSLYETEIVCKVTVEDNLPIYIFELPGDINIYSALDIFDSIYTSMVKQTNDSRFYLFIEDRLVGGVFVDVDDPVWTTYMPKEQLQSYFRLKYYLYSGFLVSELKTIGSNLVELIY